VIEVACKLYVQAGRHPKLAETVALRFPALPALGDSIEHDGDSYRVTFFRWKLNPEDLGLRDPELEAVRPA
jgi:hypothetical protein